MRPIPPAFEAFYRQHLRLAPTRRVSSATISERYGAWAITAGAQSFSARRLRLLMEDIGHRHFRSNGTWYADVALAEDMPGVPDTFPVQLIRAEPMPASMIGRLDAVLCEILAIRSELDA